MRFAFERLVKEDGTIQLPSRLAGKVVIIIEPDADLLDAKAHHEHHRLELLDHSRKNH